MCEIEGQGRQYNQSHVKVKVKAVSITRVHPLYLKNSCVIRYPAYVNECFAQSLFINWFKIGTGSAGIKKRDQRLKQNNQVVSVLPSLSKRFEEVKNKIVFTFPGYSFSIMVRILGKVTAVRV